MTSSVGKEIWLKGWKRSGITVVLEKGLEDDLDPFKNIYPIEISDKVSNSHFVIKNMGIREKCQNEDHGDDDSNWEDDDGNIFDVYIEDDEGGDYSSNAN